MTTSPSRVEDEVDDLAQRSLRSAYDRRPPPTSDPAITFRSWTPEGARTKRKRRFTLLAADGVPLLVSKMPLDHEDRKVAGEYDKLCDQVLPFELDHPRAVASTGDGFIMTYAPSEDLPDALLRGSPEHVAGLLERAIIGISAMHRHTPGRRGTDVVGNGSSAHEAARRYVAEPFADGPRFRAAIDQARVGPTHGDLAPWNLRYDAQADRISIIDWEDYQPAGVVGIDVVNLLITLGLVVFPDHRDRGVDWLYDQVLESDHWYALLVRQLISRYASLTDQSARAVIDLVPFFCQWMITRIESEGRDASALYYGRFLVRYVAGPPRWVEELPEDGEDRGA